MNRCARCGRLLRLNDLVVDVRVITRRDATIATDRTGRVAHMECPTERSNDDD